MVDATTVHAWAIPRRTPPWHQPSSRHVAENPVAGSAQAPIGWNVWLIGGSERWAAGTILVLGSWGASMIRHSRTVVPAHGAR